MLHRAQTAGFCKYQAQPCKINLARLACVYMAEEPRVEDVAAALQMSIGLCLRRLRQVQAEDELTLPEASALKRLERGGPATVTALAKQEQISVQSIGATLAGLQARGLLERRPDPGDGRRSILLITEAGRTALGDKNNARRENLVKALSAGFTQSELRLLMASAPLIERLAQSI
jgi:DNA-binding MarR family transcriptional regulator